MDKTLLEKQIETEKENVLWTTLLKLNVLYIVLKKKGLITKEEYDEALSEAKSSNPALENLCNQTDFEAWLYARMEAKTPLTQQDLKAIRDYCKQTGISEDSSEIQKIILAMAIRGAK